MFNSYVGVDIVRFKAIFVVGGMVIVIILVVVVVMMKKTIAMNLLLSCLSCW